MALQAFLKIAYACIYKIFKTLPKMYGLSASTTCFEKSTDVHMKMDMCTCAAWILDGLPGLCPGISKSLVTPLNSSYGMY